MAMILYEITDKCFIQFIETNNYITFGTAIAAFYAPVTVMCVLYWRVWRETEKRQKDLSNLQAGKKNDSHRSNSRYVRYYLDVMCGRTISFVSPVDGYIQITSS